jgi:hypothetical protein
VPEAERAAVERDWLELTRSLLPSLAAERDWPVRHDHCFQRILLDAACGGAWYDAVAARPAYKHLDLARLESAVAMARAVAAGEADLHALNARSLAWRGKRRRAWQGR